LQKRFVKNSNWIRIFFNYTRELKVATYGGISQIADRAFF
jgi:hypothetical protein